MKYQSLQPKLTVLFAFVAVVFSRSLLAAETTTWWSLDGEVSVENSVSERDHLVPYATEEDCGVIRLDLKTTRAIECLASFHMNSRDGRYQWCLEEIDGNYQITALNPQSGVRQNKNRQRFFESTTMLSPDAGKLIREIWTNALLKARYDRTGSVVLDGVHYSFTAQVESTGIRMGGQTWSPTEDLPPLWLTDAGYMINTYGLSKEKNEEKLVLSLKDLRSRLVSYYANK
jgi:hypothetical protein